MYFFFLRDKEGRAGRSQAALRGPILGHKLPRVPWSHLSRSEGGEVKKAKVCIFFSSMTKRGERAVRRPPCEALSSATNSHDSPGGTCHGRRKEREKEAKIFFHPCQRGENAHFESALRSTILGLKSLMSRLDGLFSKTGFLISCGRSPRDHRPTPICPVETAKTFSQLLPER